MEIFSIGFTQKSAREFFGALKAHGIERLLDVRLNNTSQLAAFAKQADLATLWTKSAERFMSMSLCSLPRRRFWTLIKNPRPAGRLTPSLSRSHPLSKSGVGPFQRQLQKENCPALQRAHAERCHRRLALEYLQNTGKV